MEKYNNWKLKFYTIWAGQAVSLITSAILQMAIIFYLTEKTGSAMVLSMASLVGFLPYAVFGPAIGVLVDRHDRKKIMIGADLIIAAAGAVLAIVALYMELPIWMVMVVLFIRSIGTAFHTPALNAVTPLLVPEEQLTKCAGYSQSLQSISYIVSPAVAALLYSVWELNAIIAIDVLGAVIASITVAIVRIPKLGDQVQSLKPNFIREMKEGMAVLRQNKGLFALLLVGTLYMFVYMPINALYPLITMEYFNGTPMHISITEIAYASGMLIGGLLLGLFGNYQKRILLITASIFMMGISLTISGLLPQSGFFIFVVCCAIMGLSVPFYSGLQTALFQEKIKPEYLGRVFSLTGSIMSLAMLTAATGMDALTHAIESYITPGAWVMSDMFELKAIEMIAQNLKAAVDNGKDVAAREAMSQAQYIAGMGFSNVGLGIVHSMAHPLGAFYDTPHGVANALLLPYVMEYNAESPAAPKYIHIAKAMGVDTTGMSEAEGVKAAIEAVKALSISINIPQKLHEINVKEEDIPALAVAAYNDVCTGGNPRPTSVADIEALYHKAF